MALDYGREGGRKLFREKDWSDDLTGEVLPFSRERRVGTGGKGERSGRRRRALAKRETVLITDGGST